MSISIDNIKMSRESVLDTIGILSRLAIDTSLSVLLTTAKIVSIANKSIGASIDTFIKLMEEEVKTREKVKVE